MLSKSEIIARLVLAAVLIGRNGVERERLLWAAGLRTHMLVGVGACLIVIVSAFGFSDVLRSKNVVLDPARIAAQVVSGIGFLGVDVLSGAMDGLILADQACARGPVGLSAALGRA